MQAILREISNLILGEDFLRKLAQQLRPEGSARVLCMKSKEKRIQAKRTAWVRFLKEKGAGLSRKNVWRRTVR